MKLTKTQLEELKALEKERRANEEREIHSLVEQIAKLYIDYDEAERLIYGMIEKCHQWKSASRLKRLLADETKAYALRIRNNIRRHSSLLKNVFEEPGTPRGHSLGTPAYQAEMYYNGKP